MHAARAAAHEPVVYDPTLGQWLVFGYDEVRTALADDERLTHDRMHGFADRAPREALDAVRRHAPWMISAEGADYDWVRWILHAGLRGAIGSADAIASAAHELVADLEITAECTDRMARSAAETIAYAHALIAERPGELRSGFLELVARSAAER